MINSKFCKHLDDVNNCTHNKSAKYPDHLRRCLLVSNPKVNCVHKVINSYLTCEDCGITDENVNVDADQYTLELYGETNMVTLCDKCRSIHSEEI